MRAADACFGAHGELLCERCGGSTAEVRAPSRWHIVVIVVTVMAPLLYVLTLR